MVLVEQHLSMALEVADTAGILVPGEVAPNGPAADLSDRDLLTETYLS